MSKFLLMWLLSRTTTTFCYYKWMGCTFSWWMYYLYVSRSWNKPTRWTCSTRSRGEPTSHHVDHHRGCISGLPNPSDHPRSQRSHQLQSNHGRLETRLHRFATGHPPHRFHLWPPPRSQLLAELFPLLCHVVLVQERTLQSHHAVHKLLLRLVLPILGQNFLAQGRKRRQQQPEDGIPCHHDSRRHNSQQQRSQQHPNGPNQELTTSSFVKRRQPASCWRCLSRTFNYYATSYRKLYSTSTS